MTELLEKAVDALRALPPEQQDAIASWLMEWTADETSVVVLTEDEQRSLEPSLAQAARGEFASEEEIQAMWAKFRL